MRRHKQLLIVGLSLVLLSWGGSALAAGSQPTAKPAANTPKTQKLDSEPIAKNVTQSYNADPAVQLSMIVQLKAKDAKTVEPLGGNQTRGMLGVVVPTTNAAIVLSPETVTKQQVLVAFTGRQQVLG